MTPIPPNVHMRRCYLEMVIGGVALIAAVFCDHGSDWQHTLLWLGGLSAICSRLSYTDAFIAKILEKKDG